MGKKSMTQKAARRIQSSQDKKGSKGVALMQVEVLDRYHHVTRRKILHPRRSASSRIGCPRIRFKQVIIHECDNCPNRLHEYDDKIHIYCKTDVRWGW